MTKKKFYITTAIPYVNAAPHIGHAQEFVLADAIARHHRLLGEDVLFLSGGDENALKNVQAADASNTPVNEFVDKNAKLFKKLAEKLNVNFDIFQKGSDKKHHYPSSQLLWLLCQKKGDIYKKAYKGLYCIGCETFYTKEELDKNGECLEHPGKKLQEVEEINYFFRLSKYQNLLKELIFANKLKIVPDIRRNEVLSFLKKPLQDISISRTNERAKNWGVPVPGDPTQKIYVWFDALNIYQSGVGFGWDDKLYKRWWPANVHTIGKGIIRFHAVYWPAFLMSAGLDLPKSLFVHGYLKVEGKKMSKTLGNVIDPFKLIEKYGKDPVRYFLLKEIPSYSDGDFSHKRMLEVYNSDLANELGNLISRITNIAEQDKIQNKINHHFDVNDKLFETFQLNKILENIWLEIKKLNRDIDTFAPWQKSPSQRKIFLINILTEINKIGYNLSPFLPETADKIVASTQGEIRKTPALFPKISFHPT